MSALEQTLIERFREWQHAVGRSALDRGEKAVMFALLTFIDVETGGNLFPSEGTIGRYTSMTADGVSRILDRLEMKGVMRFVRRGGGRRRTHQMKLDLAALKALEVKPIGKPVRRSGFGMPASRSLNGNNPIPHSSKPVRRSEEPSIHTPPVEPPIGESNQNGLACAGEGCMDGEQNVRAFLQRAGIGGPNLDALAVAPGLTVGEIRKEQESIIKANGVRNVAAVLFKRLAAKHGVKTGRAHSLNADTMAHLGVIEAMRRHHRRV